MSGESDDINAKIFKSVAEVFQAAQTSYAGHRKHIAVLRKIHSKAVIQGYEDAFNYWINKLITKVLPLPKNHPYARKIINLITGFVSSLERDLQEARKNSNLDEEALEQQEEVFTRFIEHFINHILRGAESKERTVRFRVVQLLALIITNIGEIDDTLYNTIMWSLKKRIFDKEAAVRTQAIFCLAQLYDVEMDTDTDDFDEPIKQLLFSIQNDSSPEVRRATLANLPNVSGTRGFLLERARDVNSINRRFVYSKILKKMGLKAFEVLNSDTLDQVLKWGLEDREESVRKACSRLISYDWLDLLNGDLIVLLENLNVTQSTIAEKAIYNIFKLRPDVLSVIKFPEDIWKELTAEITFLLKCFYKYCTESELTELIDSNFPEASVLSEYLNTYIQTRFKDATKAELSDIEKDHLNFIIEQLLVIANLYDFSDEIGRRSMLTVVRNMLSIIELPDSLIKIGFNVLKSLSINEKDFVTMGIELINDIRDDDVEKQEKIEMNNLKESSNKEDNLNNIREGGDNNDANEDNEEDEDEDDEDDDDEDDEDDEDEKDYEAIQDFHNAVENLVNGNIPSSRDMRLLNMVKETEASPETLLLCLRRSCNMLELVEKPLFQNIMLHSLIDTLIIPAVRKPEPEIRELGVKNLGLCCLLDVELATSNMQLLGQCVSKAHPALKDIALQCIIDIFSVHGTEVVDGEGKIDSIVLYKMFYKVLKATDLPNSQVIVAEGLCKLYLTNILSDDDLFETLILTYFSPANFKNEALIQAFAFCLPVYCFSHTTHQQRMARVAADVMLRLCILWEDLQSNMSETQLDPESMSKPSTIFQQLINWTDPRNIVKRSQYDIDKDTTQLDFLLNILNSFNSVEKAQIRKMLLTNINQFYINPEQDISKLKQILLIISDILETETHDAVSKNSIKKFQQSLEKVVEEASVKAANNTGDSNEQYSIILETTQSRVESDDIPSLGQNNNELDENQSMEKNYINPPSQQNNYSQENNNNSADMTVSSSTELKRNNETQSKSSTSITNMDPPLARNPRKRTRSQIFTEPDSLSNENITQDISQNNDTMKSVSFLLPQDDVVKNSIKPTLTLGETNLSDDEMSIDEDDSDFASSSFFTSVS